MFRLQMSLWKFRISSVDVFQRYQCQGETNIAWMAEEGNGMLFLIALKHKHNFPCEVSQWFSEIQQKEVVAPQHRFFFSCPLLIVAETTCKRHVWGTEEQVFGIIKAKHIPGGLPDLSDACYGTGNRKLKDLPWPLLQPLLPKFEPYLWRH